MKRNNRQSMRKTSAAMEKAGTHATQGDAIALLQAGQLGEAASILQEVIANDPKNWQSLHLLGLTAYKQRKFEESADYIRRALAVKPDLPEAYSDLGVVLKELGQLEDARKACSTALALKPDFHPAYSNLGNVLKASGRLEDAMIAYQKAITLVPNYATAHSNLGAVLVKLGKIEEALASCRKAVSLAPNVAEVYIALAQALRLNGKNEEALDAYRTAIKLRPAHAPTYTDLGGFLLHLKRHEEALQIFQQALLLQPDLAETHNDIAVALRDLGRDREALEHCRKAIALKPDFVDAYTNLGALLDQTGEFTEALSVYDQAIKISPNNFRPYLNLAVSLWKKRFHAETLEAYRKVLEFNPNHPTALVDYFHVRSHVCDWEGGETTVERILQNTFRMGKRVSPFALLNIPCGPEDQLLCAREWAKSLPQVIVKPFTYAPPRSGSGDGRIRIGYLSADYNQHATALLVTELLERHDRNRFEIFGYCFSNNDKSAIRQRIITAFDRFEPIAHLSHADAARRIHRDNIDILVDLKGYTAGARTEILVCRPAPIQLNYLGFPGTMGADFIDYIIADPFIAPMDQALFYDEKIVHMPHSYQPNDTKRAFANEVPTRADFGLPEKAFVFCCLNNTYKISSEVFVIWMRLLKAVPESVLWLMQLSDLGRDNLQREAVAHGVDPSRLIFSPKLSVPQHLARQCLADLFLDTLPVNAHTTASDALWGGLPILTCAGSSFVSRVCGSLLHAVGLPELATHSLADYEAMALKLAREPETLANIRKKLTRDRLVTTPLFDIEQYSRDLETAYEHMVTLRETGEAPQAFAVADITSSLKEKDTWTKSVVTRTLPVSKPRPVTSAANQSVKTLTSVRTLYEACPLCAAKDIKPHREGSCVEHPCYNAILPPTMRWSRCNSCGHIFTEGHFTPEAAKIIFSKTMPHQAVGHNMEAQRVVSARIVERVIPFAPEPKPDLHKTHSKSGTKCDDKFCRGDWLDVGFGNASLIFTAEEWGFHAVGLDLRKENVRALAALNVEAHCIPIEELDFVNRFTVISMADVLEHVPYPATALKAAQRLLQPHGALFLSMPNLDTMVWHSLDVINANPYWGEIEHYHNFSRTRLYAFLEEHGFSPVSYHISERYRACMEVVAVKI
jgi:protein O-GlcNAc transferase